MYSEDFKKLLLWKMTHFWGNHYRHIDKNTDICTISKEDLKAQTWHEYTYTVLFKGVFLYFYLRNESDKDFNSSVVKSSLGRISNLQFPPECHESRKQEREKQKGTQSKKQIGKERQGERQRKKEIRVCLQNSTNGCQGRGSCARPCFHSDPNVLSVQWRQLGALHCGRADMSHTCQCPADSTEDMPVSIHSTYVTPRRDTGTPGVWTKETRCPKLGGWWPRTVWPLLMEERLWD